MIDDEMQKSKKLKLYQTFKNRIDAENFASYFKGKGRETEIKATNPVTKFRKNHSWAVYVEPQEVKLVPEYMYIDKPKVSRSLEEERAEIEEGLKRKIVRFPSSKKVVIESIHGKNPKIKYRYSPNWVTDEVKTIPKKQGLFKKIIKKLGFSSKG